MISPSKYLYFETTAAKIQQRQEKSRVRDMLTGAARWAARVAQKVIRDVLLTVATEWNGHPSLVKCI